VDCGPAIAAAVFRVGEWLLLLLALRDPAVKTHRIGVAGAPLTAALDGNPAATNQC
jgi:hypothetical protein